ncbi:MAG: hypothetical protein NZ957_05265 [Thaumarchaeota archaeon]|nr:hypothetical protein [Candidatus Calditenuaceae archaeon]
MIDLSLNPGDRYVIEVATSGLSDVYVIEANHFHHFKETGKPPSSAVAFSMVKSLSLALPTNSGGDYKLVIKQLKDGEVKVTIKHGLVEEAVSRMRKGESVLRNSLVAELPPGQVYVIPIYQFVMGTQLEMEVQRVEKAAVLSFSEYLAYRRGSKSLEALCVTERCISGSGSLKLSSGDFGDVYVVVHVTKDVAALNLRVIATPEMLLYSGTCG